MAQGPQYRWWPRFVPSSIHVTDKRLGATTSVGVLMVVAVFWVPAVERATTIPPIGASALLLSFAAWSWISRRFLSDRARHDVVAFRVLAAGNMSFALGISLALVLVGGEPKTPLWAAFCVYAAFNGAAHELDASLGFLLLHTFAPLLAIPLFFTRGADPAWSVAGPAMGAAFSLISYHYMAMRADLTRVALRERDEARTRASQLEQEAAGRQLARDIHDSVGSALSLFGLCGDLIQRHRGEPVEIDRIAVALRDSARDGLGDLRGVLDAMAPAAGDVESMGSNLRRAAARLAASSGASVELETAGGAGVGVDGAARVAVVRVFQEAASNALRHGRAQTVRAALRVEGNVLILTVADDGVGFNPASARVGRGLPGMRSRANDLGGTLAVASAAGDGARVTLRLPLAAARG
jgi:signal transduction histidine kinase